MRNERLELHDGIHPEIGQKHGQEGEERSGDHANPAPGISSKGESTVARLAILLSVDDPHKECGQNTSKGEECQESGIGGESDGLRPQLGHRQGGQQESQESKNAGCNREHLSSHNETTALFVASGDGSNLINVIILAGVLPERVVNGEFTVFPQTDLPPFERGNVLPRPWHEDGDQGEEKHQQRTHGSDEVVLLSRVLNARTGSAHFM